MAHYFENDETLKSEEKKIKVNIKNEQYSFLTDNGVFSKKGLDFGTRTLLESLEIDNICGKVLDLGCGYGPIGIFVSKNSKAEIHMIDINKRSLQLARKNIEINQTKAKIYESNIYENVKDKFDFIITNPPIRIGKKMLYEILFDAKKHLNDNGELWIVINKDQGAKSLIKDLEKEYSVVIKNKNKGFYIICATKR